MPGTLSQPHGVLPRLLPLLLIAGCGDAGDPSGRHPVQALSIDEVESALVVRFEAPEDARFEPRVVGYQVHYAAAVAGMAPFAAVASAGESPVLADLSETAITLDNLYSGHLYEVSVAPRYSDDTVGPIAERQVGVPRLELGAFVEVPAGELRMGSAEGVGEDDERPAHRIFVERFFIHRYEVTRGEYAGCMSAGACTQPGRAVEGAGIDDPVLYVTWRQAERYCTFVGARLPTEAQWEKAARGPGESLYPWGDDAPSCTRANYAAPGGDCVGSAVGAGLAPWSASGYGLEDAAGNAWEWVADWYDPDYYAASPPADPVGPDSGTQRVLRGGGLDSDEGALRASARAALDPELGPNPEDWPAVGIRCVRPEAPR